MDTEQATVPYGFCHCGCGRRTGIVARSQSAKGWVRGEPKRFVHGHNGQRVRLEDHLQPGAADECWEWHGGRLPNGYGQFGRQHLLAHRVAYERAHGPIPEGMRVLHRCDNPPCCNPAHLFLGTMSDNVVDMMAKGRHGHCLGSPMTEDMVREIRRRHAAGETAATLGREFGRAKCTIEQMVRGYTWRHVA